jgi:antitoxin component YwqK of YwqJK toxin-antitoxin module
MTGSTYSYVSDGVLREVVDGVLRREQPKRDGEARSWHPNGTLAKQWTLVNGLVQGVMREWHENGVLARETPFERGLINGTVKQWSTQGKLLGEYELRFGRGVKREWNDDGTPSLEIEQLTESGTKGKVWDDLGNASEVYLWNGKPVSKKKFFEKLKREEL